MSICQDIIKLKINIANYFLTFCVVINANCSLPISVYVSIIEVSWNPPPLLESVAKALSSPLKAITGFTKL